jgi:class 3 adenylate cyclase/tetratricopeptide (TPR) repeat protein
MTFDEILDQVRELLRERRRVSYAALKRRFELSDEVLEDLKVELIEAEQVAADENGRILVWTGVSPVPSATFQVQSSQSPTPSTQLLTPSTQTLDARRADGERRQLTVQFIDLVGSTTLSEQLDPEDYHARVRAYQTACHQVIARYEGHVAQYLGDGLLVYFGYPTAHEEDAVRAVRSGLEIVAAVGQLGFTPRLQVRIGIHTGLVMVGDIGEGERRERLALGDTPNIAARVQGQAEPNTVFISQATYRLVHGFFRCEALGPQSLKNVSAPLELYRVQGEGEAQSRFEVAVQKGLTPLVGRAEELALLQRYWEHARAGAGQVVLVSGEPGIGKSRLVQELKEQVSAEGATRLEFRCSPYHQHSALYPIIDHLQRLLQFAREDSPAVKLEKLQHRLSHYHFPQADTVPLLAALLSLPHPEDYPPITGSPQKQKEKTQAALVAWLVEEAEKAAVYCAWEDLHWADPSTLEVLTLLLDQVPTTRLLALLTFRPEFMPPWGNRSHLSQLTLSRLERTQTEAMVERVTGGKTLPVEVMQQIVAKTDGVPLFVEELTKSVVESVGAIHELPLQLGIPATLQDALMARLDRLGSAKDIAQLGATIGREFSYELLQAVAPLDEATLQQSLTQLVESELVYQRGVVPQVQYLFKHALIQDTAYQSLLKSKRRYYHQQIARVLEEQFPDTIEAQPELVAHHYTEASLVAQALPYWQQAGQRAAQRSAHVEAIKHFTKGLELLKTLPDMPERVQQKLTLQLALGGSLIAAKGFGALEVEQAYGRALELCRQVGETPQLFEALFGLQVFYEMRAEYRTALQLGEQLLRLAQSIQDPASLVWAHHGLGVALLYLGEIALSLEHQEQGVALYTSQPYNPYSLSWPDPGVVCLDYAAHALSILGYPDQALERVQEALALARKLAHPFSLAYAMDAVAAVHLVRGEGQAAQEWAEVVMTLSIEQGFPYWLAFGSFRRGLALVLQGQGEEGIALMQQGLAAQRATGMEMARTGFLTMLAAAYGRVGLVEEGLAVVVEALTVVDNTGERVSEAGLYVLKGWFTLQKLSVAGGQLSVPNPQSATPNPQAKAEEYFLKAIEIARRQQAKLLELRAVMSLSRLWQQQGKKAEAHRMLSEIYNWFTEGFDTKDLQEAKALLEELSH